MSFTEDIKKEIVSKTHWSKEEMTCILIGYIRYNADIIFLGQGKWTLTIKSHKPYIARFIKENLKNVLNIETKLIITTAGINQKRLYKIVPDDFDGNHILVQTGLMIVDMLGMLSFADTVPPIAYKSKKNKIATFVGFFLSKGIVENPKKNYHLAIEGLSFTELSCFFKIENIFNRIGIFFKEQQRDNGFSLYLKKSSDILDILAILKVSDSFFELENIIIEKDQKRKANRVTNYEMANIEKSLNTANKHIEIINKIGIKNLPDSLKQIAFARIANPNLNITELGQMLGFSKQRAYNKLKAIVDIYNKNGKVTTQQK